MDQPPKEPTDSSILADLEKALLDADRCIELARLQRRRIDTASQALRAGGLHAEDHWLEQARKGREQLEAPEVRVEVTSSPALEGAAPPPVDPSPALPLLEEAVVPA